MAARATEYPHNTYEQVEGYLSEALRLVAALELDDDLKVPAFVKAVDLLAGKQIFYEQIAALSPSMAIPRGL